MVKAIGTTRNLEQPQLESAPVAVAASPKDRIRKPKVAPTESRANPCRISLILLFSLILLRLIL